MPFSWEIAYKTILTLTLTKQALRPSGARGAPRSWWPRLSLARRHSSTQVPGSPTKNTGAPSKRRQHESRFLSKVLANALKVCYSRGVWRPKRVTGVLSKKYRGLQQKVPGSSARNTGVSNKKYRGAQQKVPGCPTKSTGVPNKEAWEIPCKQAGFLLSAEALCIVMFSCCFV
jgi:hypothetical protein